MEAGDDPRPSQNDAQQQDDGRLEHGVRGSTNHLSHKHGRPGDGGHHHLLQKIDLPVPDDVDPEKNGRKKDGLGQNAGIDKGLVVDPLHGDAGSQATAEDDQPHDGAGDGAHHPGPLPQEDLELPVPDGQNSVDFVHFKYQWDADKR